MELLSAKSCKFNKSKTTHSIFVVYISENQAFFSDSYSYFSPFRPQSIQV